MALWKEAAGAPAGARNGRKPGDHSGDRPRKVPERGTVLVWVDAGSGVNGQRIVVDVRDLQAAEGEDGQGRSALYVLRTRSGPG